MNLSVLASNTASQTHFEYPTMYSILPFIGALSTDPLSTRSHPPAPFVCSAASRYRQTHPHLHMGFCYCPLTSSPAKTKFALTYGFSCVQILIPQESTQRDHNLRYRARTSQRKLSSTLSIFLRSLAHTLLDLDDDSTRATSLSSAIQPQGSLYSASKLFIHTPIILT